MTNQEVLTMYISYYCDNLLKTPGIRKKLIKEGITENFVFETFKLGYSDGSIVARIKESEEHIDSLSKLRITNKEQDIFTNHLIIPIFDENNVPVNIVGYSLHPQKKEKLIYLNDTGIFNEAFIRKAEELIVTENPMQALLLMQNEHPNTTFLYGTDQKYVTFLENITYKKVVFTFDGKARLFYEISKSGTSTVRTAVDFSRIQQVDGKEYLASLFTDTKSGSSGETSDTIQEIENGFLFKLPLLNYRVIGNFKEYSVNMKVNIKAYKDEEIFVDSIDLYKNRDRQNFIYNLMERFEIRDQVQIEHDLTHILDVIEKHKERKEKERKKTKPVLTEYQQQIGIELLTDKNLIDEIETDYEQLGYVRERKNKLLLYLVMTSRLTNNPLHAVLISRSGAGKSQLAEVTELLCPPEDVESISDLSAQALYYYGEDDLKHKFIVIGEKKGSQGSDYPLRELISRKSITKAVPMKDSVTGQVKTESITVNGPISLVETTTSGEINPENLNRCYVIGIDESEEQTALIHQLQRKNQTVEGFLEKKNREKVIQKHIFAQRMLKPIQVFNPYAELLTFPSASLRSRRDNEKFLRLISSICFLHQYQRKVKKLKVDSKEEIEYIECTVEDYTLAYELLSDGVLDYTLDDLPRPARKLLELIKTYLQEKAKQDSISLDKIIFERKDIREYTSWSFAQVRNNFRILKDYEYIKLIKAQNGLANQYKLSGAYSDLDFLRKILSPEELEQKVKEKKAKNNLNTVNTPEHQGSKLVTV